MFRGCVNGRTASVLVRSGVAALVVACGVVPAALGQEKPSPQPLAPYVEPELDVSMWAQVYAMANRPRILVLCGYGTDRHQAMDPGQVLSNLDSTSVTHKIRAALVGELNAAGADIEVVDDNALRAVMSRLKDNANLSGDLEGSELLKQQLGADLLVLVRLGDSQLEGSPFSAVVESSDLSRGRVGASFPFDWKGGTDAMNVKANARAVAIKFVNDFAVRVNHPVRYTVEVFGADTVEMQRRTLEGLNGLSGLRGQARTRTGGTVRDTGTGKGEAFTEYEVTFVRGSDPDPTTLVSDISEIMRSRFNILVEPRQGEGGRIAIRVKAGEGGVRSGDSPAPQTQAPAPSTAVPPAPAPVPQAPAPQQTQGSDLRALYVQKGSPRTVVLINRAATIDEWNDWRGTAGSASADNIIIVGGSPSVSGGAGSNAAKDQFVDPSVLELWARQVEQAVSGTLSNDYGISMQISPDLARASLLTKLENGQKYMGADQLLGLLRKEDVADVAIVGCGKIVSGVAGYEMVYTLETVELATSRRLGAALITSPLRGLSASDAVRRASDSFASRAAQQAAGALQSAWSSAGAIELTIRGVSSDEEARQIASAVREKSKSLVLGGNSAFRTENGTGIVTFTGTFAGSPQDAAAELQRALGEAHVPLTLTVSSREGSKVGMEVKR